MRRLVIVYAALLLGGCATPQSPATPVPPTATLPPSPAAAPTTSPSVVPTATPTIAPTRVPTIAALPTIETTADLANGPGFLRAVDLDLDFEQPVTDQVTLRQLVNGVQQLDGVASVRSDGVRVLVSYDSTRVLPARIRDRLRELGHPVRGGTDVQNPGDAAD